METHQTTDLGIAGSIPAGLVFLYDINMIDTTQQTKKQRNKEKKTENPNCTHNYLFNTHTKNLFIFTYPLPYMLLCAQHHIFNNYIRLYKNTIMPLDNQIQKCSRQVSNLRPWRY